MKNKTRLFALKSMNFLIILVLIIFLMNIFFSNYIIPYSRLTKQEKLYHQHKENISILFFGDSHPVSDIYHEYIPGSMVIGVLGGTYDETYYVLRKELKENQNLKTLAFQLDVQSFTNTDYRPRFLPVHYWKNYLSLKELMDRTNGDLPSLMFRYHMPFLGNARDMGLPFQAKGNLSKEFNHENFSDTEKQVLNRVRLQLGDREFNNQSFESFRQVLELAQSFNVTVVLIKYPVTSIYLEKAKEVDFDVEAYYEKINNSLKDFEGVTVLDYQSFIKDIDLFYDGDHLNVRGAKKLSKQLAEDLLELDVIEE